MPMCGVLEELESLENLGEGLALADFLLACRKNPWRDEVVCCSLVLR